MMASLQLSIFSSLYFAMDRAVAEANCCNRGSVYFLPAVSQQGHSYPSPRDNVFNQLLAVLSIRADMPIISSVYRCLRSVFAHYR
jgi:hypothetical protein